MVKIGLFLDNKVIEKIIYDFEFFPRSKQKMICSQLEFSSILKYASLSSIQKNEFVAAQGLKVLKSVKMAENDLWWHILLYF